MTRPEKIKEYFEEIYASFDFNNHKYNSKVANFEEFNKELLYDSLITDNVQQSYKNIENAKIQIKYNPIISVKNILIVLSIIYGIVMLISYGIFKSSSYLPYIFKGISAAFILLFLYLFFSSFKPQYVYFFRNNETKSLIFKFGKKDFQYYLDMNRTIRVKNRIEKTSSHSSGMSTLLGYNYIIGKLDCEHSLNGYKITTTNMKEVTGTEKVLYLNEDLTPIKIKINNLFSFYFKEINNSKMSLTIPREILHLCDKYNMPKPPEISQINIF